MNAIDWNKAPEGFPVWVESHYKNDPSDWHVRVEKGYKDRNGGMWFNHQVEAGECTVHVHPEWTGEGLPPVGTVCEWFSDSARGWLTVNIAYQSSWVVVVQDTRTRPGNAEHGPTDIALEIDRDHPKFRPIRTAAQVAAEERDEEIAAILKIMQNEACACDPDGSVTAAFLYDAGYRKQEQK